MLCNSSTNFEMAENKAIQINEGRLMGECQVDPGTSSEVLSGQTGTISVFKKNDYNKLNQ
jgi:hypothetical protein